ncbi:MAG: type II and III secretion system protein [Terriglobales bacterium]
MQWLRAGILLSLAFVFLAADCRATDAASLSAASTCSKTGGALDCPASGPAPLPNSGKDRKAAHHAFDRGLKLEHAGKLDEAFDQFEEASRLVPQNAEYLAASVMTRQNLAGTHLQRGNQDLLEGRQADALTEFRTALNLDPQNEYAQQRVLDAAGPPAVRTPGRVQVVASADRITAKPLDALHDIHYAGDSRGLLTAVAASYGLTVTFDDSFPTRHVRFDIDQADFATALQAALAVTKSFAVPIEDTVLFAAPDNPESHRLYDRMGMRSFYISGADQAKDLTDLVNSLRILFEFRFLSLNTASSTITVRGPIGALEAATKFLGQINSPRPEVLLDVQVFEVSHTFARNIGLHFPDQFNLFNIPASALAALGGQNIQQLINQLIASGGINQAGNTTIASLLSQLQGQANSVFSQPVATFGGGLTFFGLSLDQLAAVLSLNESSARSLQQVTLRASQEKEATFKVGSRYPVLNASFSPISNSPAIAGVLGNQSYTAPFPSVNYEDIGLTLKAKPLVHGNSDVALELSMQIRALGAGDVNGVPIITSREFTGGILLKNGEPAFIAGMITQSDQRSLDGLPLFSRVPGFGVLTSQNSRQEMDDELVILVTPHVVSQPERSEAPEIWVSR